MLGAALWAPRIPGREERERPSCTFGSLLPSQGTWDPPFNLQAWLLLPEEGKFCISDCQGSFVLENNMICLFWRELRTWCDEVYCVSCAPCHLNLAPSLISARGEFLAVRASCVCSGGFYMGTLGNCYRLEPGPLGSSIGSQLPALVTLGCNSLPFMHQPIICKMRRIEYPPHWGVRKTFEIVPNTQHSMHFSVDTHTHSQRCSISSRQR